MSIHVVYFVASSRCIWPGVSILP